MASTADPASSWSPTVQAVALDEITSAGEVIRRILDRHPQDYSPGTRPAWGTTDVPEQSARAWVAAAEKLFVGTELFGRLVIIGLASLDTSAGLVAFRSGLLWRLASELQPSLGTLLSPLGRRQFSRRHPF